MFTVDARKSAMPFFETSQLFNKIIRPLLVFPDFEDSFYGVSDPILWQDPLSEDDIDTSQMAFEGSYATQENTHHYQKSPRSSMLCTFCHKELDKDGMCSSCLSDFMNLESCTTDDGAENVYDARGAMDEMRSDLLPEEPMQTSNFTTANGLNEDSVTSFAASTMEELPSISTESSSLDDQNCQGLTPKLRCIPQRPWDRERPSLIQQNQRSKAALNKPGRSTPPRTDRCITCSKTSKRISSENPFCDMCLCGQRRQSSKNTRDSGGMGMTEAVGGSRLLV